MATFYYLVSGATVSEEDDLVHLDKESEDLSWTHVHSPSEGEIEDILRHVGAPEEIEEMMLDGQPHPEVLTSEACVGAAIPIQVPGTWVRDYLRFLITGRHIVTISETPIEYIERYRQTVLAKGTETGDARLGGILEVCGRADRNALRAMRDKVDELADLIEEHPERVEISDVRRLKRAIVVCGNICEDQSFVFTSFGSPAVLAAVGGERTELRATLMTLVRFVDRSFDRLDVRARELEDHLYFVYQKKTEDRLRVLTVISAIFMPLTLIAGIYGMNFEEMPELGVENAYFYCLAAMAGVSAGMLGWFFKKGWLAPSR